MDRTNNEERIFGTRKKRILFGLFISLTASVALILVAYFLGEAWFITTVIGLFALGGILEAIGTKFRK